MRPSIDEAKALQSDLGLKDTHVVWLDESGFTMAHTDEERATINLEDCELHLWLDENGPPEDFQGAAWYVARRREHDPSSHDPYSQSFRSPGGPWVFERLHEKDSLG
jgi:hypothetical protein